MKIDEKRKAIDLRSQGYSLKEIASELGVAKSTVSVWVRNIVLDSNANKRIQILRESSYQRRNSDHYAKFTERRTAWREEGRKLITNQAAVDVALLYWAEGHKKNNKNTVAFTNSDPSMIFIFMRKLMSGYDVDLSSITISLNAYSDIHNETEILQYWKTILNIDTHAIRGITLNSISNYSKHKRCGLLEWGTCKLLVHSTEILQKIYGVIDAYTEMNGMKSDCTSEMRL